MKKVLLIGAVTLGISAMAGSALASTQNNEESTPAKIATPSIEVSAEERAILEKEMLEMEGTPAVASTEAMKTTPAAELTPATEATAEEIAEFEKNATPAAKTTPATEATAEEIAAHEKELASKK